MSPNFGRALPSKETNRKSLKCINGINMKMYTYNVSEDVSFKLSQRRSLISACIFTQGLQSEYLGNYIFNSNIA